MLELWELAALAGVGVVAGFVDAVAGGGGLIALPALLSFGVPPIAALATNKAQGIVGTAVAAITFWRQGLVPLRPMLVPMVATFLGAYAGAMAVKALDVAVLEWLVPAAVIGVALYFVFSPAAGDLDKRALLPFALGVPAMGMAVGFYDGAFGPGTGSFMMVGFVALFGLGVTRALAHTKVLNVTSNAAALALFLPAGDIVWPAALAMAAGQVAGGWLGARTSLKYGARIIRPLVILVSIALAARLLLFR